MQPTKPMAEDVLDDWVRQAEQSKIPQLMTMAVTMKAYRRGDSRVVRLPSLHGKGRGNQQQYKGDETKRIWIQG